MAEVIDNIADWVEGVNFSLSSMTSSGIFLGIQLFFFAVFIAVSAFVILKFYQTLSKKNFIRLDLRKYNTSRHPVFKKVFAVLLYFVEYVLIMPFFILVWFVILALILLMLASEREIVQILMLSAAIVMAIRILAYYNEEISKELGKLFPLIALSVFLLTPGAITIANFFGKLKELPGFFTNIIYYLIFISLLEIIMRFIYILSELYKGREEVGEEDEDE